MKIIGRYSFKDGEKAVTRHYPLLLQEVEQIIHSVKTSNLKTKRSREKTKPGRMLYAPKRINQAFKQQFLPRGWNPVSVPCTYSQSHYVPGYQPAQISRGAFREMDFIKQNLGVEVQFGKYAFMVYNVCAKMTIFHKLGHINMGIEIVPVKEFAQKMSSGVSYFEQFVWDLDHRGISNIDIPVLILGIG